jgi:cyclophilin family peptidyl-prolyl cis-trans isomerase
MVLDGYTAPITTGTMVDLINRGFYNGMHIQRSDGFVVQTGDPSSELEGDKATKLNGFVQGGKVRKVCRAAAHANESNAWDGNRPETPGSHTRERARWPPAGMTPSSPPQIPLEVMVKGDKAPIYGSTFDDDGRGGYASVLPFNAYGALGMAREEYDADSASSQFFWLLFDSDLTPAGIPSPPTPSPTLSPTAHTAHLTRLFLLDPHLASSQSSGCCSTREAGAGLLSPTSLPSPLPDTPPPPQPTPPPPLP